jgi:beta-phosphoglucomutase
MIGGVIFDFDGVIADSHPVHLQAWKAFLLSERKTVCNAELSFVLEGATREDILAHFFGDLTKEQIRRFGEEKNQLFQARANEIRLIRGFVEFLAQLDAAGIPSAVATSGSRRRVQQALQTFNLVSRFRSVLTAEDVSRGKPDPALFLLSAQALQLDPGQILVCEDAVAGVIAAKAAGMKCIGIAANGRRFPLKQAGCDLVVDDFRDASFDEVSRLFT